MHINADGTGRTVISNSGDYQPVWSPDGSKIAFVSYRTSDNEIYVINSDGTNLIRLTNNPDDDMTPVWSPNSMKLAFMHRVDYTNKDIFVIDVDGSNQTNLTDFPGDDFDPAWSPDGSRIAFASWRDIPGIYVMNADGTNLTNLAGQGQTPVWQPAPTNLPPLPTTYSIVVHVTDPEGNDWGGITVNLSGTETGTRQTGQMGNGALFWDLAAGGNYTFTPANDYYVFAPLSLTFNNLSSNQTATFIVSPPPEETPTPTPEPTPTPDPSPTATPTPAPTPIQLSGGKIAFTSNRDGNQEVYVMNADGSDQTNISSNPANDLAPTRSPDGTRIAFASNRDGNQQIYVMNADGTNQTRISNNNANDNIPRWSPDGTKIAFQTDRDGNVEVYMMNADGSGQTNLSNNPNYDSFPTWSPDSSRLAFATTRDGNLQIYVMDADGSNQTRITQDSAVDHYPSWSSDGSQILFASNVDGQFQIYVMNADGTGQTQLTNVLAHNLSPSLSSDGAYILFDSLRDGNGEIYIMNSDGSSQTRLTDNEASDFGAIWLSAASSPTPTPTPTPSPSPSTAATSTAIGSSLNPSVSGQSITFTASVTSSTAPTGQVQFFDGSTPLATVQLAGASASLSIASLSPGDHPITASYSGDANSSSSTSPVLHQIVNPVLTTLTLTPRNVVGSLAATGSVVLNGPAPGGGITLALSSNSPVATLPASVVVSAGADRADFAISTTEVTADTSVSITATLNGKTKTSVLIVHPIALKSLTVSPANVTGGVSATGKITLNAPAPSGGKTVALSSDNGVAGIPATATVAEGASTASFTITTTPVDADVLVGISATYAGLTKNSALTVKEPIIKSVQLHPASVIGGVSSSGTITLSGPAPSGGVSISLAGNDASVSLPSSLIIPEASNSGTFPLTTTAVANDVAVSITATVEGSSKTATLTVKAPLPKAISFSPASLVGGAGSTGTITLNGIAPAGGLEIVLSSADSAAAAVPGSLTILEGQTTGSFAVATSPVATNTVVSVSASRGSTTRTANLTVKAPAPTSLIITPSSVTGGTTAAAVLTMTGRAPASGLEVALSTTNAAAILPASVTIPPGEDTVSIEVRTSAVIAQTTGSVSATFNGVTKAGTLSVKAPVVSAVSLSPGEVGGGSVSTGTVTLTGPAPTGGVVIQLTSSRTATANVPSSVNIPAGESTAAFAITTNAVTVARAVVISATLGVKKTATLTVVPVALGGMSVDLPNVAVGASAVLTVTLNAPAPSGGFAIALSSSDSAVVSVPTSITMAQGTSSMTLTLWANAPGTSTLTAAAYGAAFTATLTAGP